MLQQLYIIPDDDSSQTTFGKDGSAPPLPLPSLDDTLARYYASLKPFGNAEELRHSRTIIEKFRNGVGPKLHAVLEERARNYKNWVEKWWEDYAYCTDRTPIFPYTAMAQAVLIESVNVEESAAESLKTLARIMSATLDYLALYRANKLRPSKNAETTFSSFLLRRFIYSIRIPGEQMDRIETYFKTADEGAVPTNFIIIAKGRIFSVDFTTLDGCTLNSQQILKILQDIRATVDSQADCSDPVAILTCDNRTMWAQNRIYLKELTPHNGNSLKLIEQSAIVVSLDENCPANLSENTIKTIAGDLHSRWADKSSHMVLFRNGKVGFIGEHSCYDGTISIAFSTYILLSLLELPVPDWNEPANTAVIRPIKEIVFDLDAHLKEEIKRVMVFCDKSKTDIILSASPFTGYGKKFMKAHRLHPDAYIQMILQLTYYRMHNEIVATYETALMRNYYNGRTETVRSCSMDALNWVQSYLDSNLTDEQKCTQFKKAVRNQQQLMDDARMGKGIDRHLFGMWCAAYEADIETPELYDDPLYKKSGGGGNFVLSTSTLGYTINNGFVGPMCLDGYSIFYSITNDVIWINVCAFRESTKTSSHKFVTLFDQTMLEIRDLIERTSTVSKL